MSPKHYLKHNRQAGQLLALLAPVVMGALGHAHSLGQLDTTTLPAALDSAGQQVSGSPDMYGMLSQLLDSDHDGSSMDDVMRLTAGFFGGKGVERGAGRVI